MRGGVAQCLAFAAALLATTRAIGESPLAPSLVCAFDAGLMRVIHSGEGQAIVSRYSKLFAASWTCNPDPSMYTFPVKTTLTDADALKVVLDRGSLRIGGFKADWGSDGNYEASPPIGFYPDLLEAVVAEIRAAYAQDLQIERVYLDTTVKILESLRDGTDAALENQLDMTEPYFFVSSLFTDSNDGKTYFRSERFQMSCTIGSAEHFGFTSKSDPNAIYTQQGLNDYIDSQDQKTLVGTLTKGNYQQYSPVLSKNAEGSYVTEVRVQNASQVSALVGKLNDKLEVLQQHEFAGTMLFEHWTLTHVDSVAVKTKEALQAMNLDYGTGVTLTFDHFADTDHLVQAVKRGDVKAGIVVAVPEISQDTDLNSFKMSLLSPQAALFRKDKPADLCLQSAYLPRASQSCGDNVQTPANALSSTLVRAFDAGLVRVMAGGAWQDIVSRYSKPFAASWTCSPDPDGYPFPVESELKSHDALQRVLNKGMLRVAGFEANWGTDGDYTKPTPTGFYPELLEATVNEIRKAYGRSAETLQVKRVYLDTTPAILNALKQGDRAPAESQVDMTEPFMFVSSFFTDADNINYFRHEKFQMSCAIGSATHMGFTSRESKIYDEHGLNDWIGKQEAGTLVGTLTKGNFQQYQPLLNPKAVGSYVTEVVLTSDQLWEKLQKSLSDNLQVNQTLQLGSTTIRKNWTLTSLHIGDRTHSVKSVLDVNALILTNNIDGGIRFSFDHFGDTAQIVEAVIRGDVKVGIISSVPSLKQNTKLNTFEMSLLSPQAALFRKDEPADICPARGFVSEAYVARKCPGPSAMTQLGTFEPKLLETSSTRHGSDARYLHTVLYGVAVIVLMSIRKP